MCCTCTCRLYVYILNLIFASHVQKTNDPLDIFHRINTKWPNNCELVHFLHNVAALFMQAVLKPSIIWCLDAINYCKVSGESGFPHWAFLET